MISELDEIMHDIAPRLKGFSDNPCLLLEENFSISKDGYLQDRVTGRPTEMLITSYYGYLETLRKMGLDVYCTRDLNASIWWLVAMHGYLGKNHYPPHKKRFNDGECAVSMLASVSGIGDIRAIKALKTQSIRAMCGMNKIDGLTVKQLERLKSVLRYTGAL